MNKLVVVADASRARFFQQPNRNTLVEVEDLVDPEGRLHERDLTSDRPGRDGNSDARSHHAMDPSASAKDQELTRFAKSIAERLETARNEGTDAFVLVAPPRLLGMLRQSLSKGVEKQVVQEVNQELTQATEPEILKHLQG